jgi:dihydropteroate synthase
MGILNVTPDSFSDGGAYFSKESALAHAYDLIDDGADILDIGGESTKPGSCPVPEEEEIKRVVEIIRELAQTISIPISVDTMKPRVAELSIKAGASIINDICGLRDDRMTDIAIDHDIPAVITHMHGRPETFKEDMMKGDVLNEIKMFLDKRAEHAIGMGMKENNIIFDPGVGFGKTAEQDLKIIENGGWFSEKYPVLIGPSRKRFLSQHYPGIDKDEATAMVSIIAAEKGAGILRVHNVSNVINALGKKLS